jgi:putative hemolysin
MEIAVQLLFLSFLVLCSAYFSASETALFSLPLTKIKTYQTSLSPRQRLIAQLVLEPRNLLVTVFMLNTLVNILIQNTTSHLYGENANWILKVGVPLVIMLLLGEIIPKNIGLQNNVKIANLVAPSINFMQKFITPVRDLVVKVTAPISRTIFFFLRPKESISKEEIQHVLKTSEEKGVLQPDETELVLGYLNLQDATAKMLMRPKNDILYFDINDSFSKLLYLFIEQECSRLPVCDKSLDNVLGIITARQLFLHKKQIHTSKDLIQYLVNPLYIPESTPAKTIARHFDECHQVIALVVDEYGSITGLITKEDIMEQVIGDISDLRDTKILYEKSSANEIIASGQLELAEFNDLFNVNLVSENNMMTIGGWLIERLGDIPKNGMKNEFEGFLFQVLSADPNKIKRLYIRKLKASPK